MQQRHQVDVAAIATSNAQVVAHRASRVAPTVALVVALVAMANRQPPPKSVNKRFYELPTPLVKPLST